MMSLICNCSVETAIGLQRQDSNYGSEELLLGDSNGVVAMNLIAATQQQFLTSIIAVLLQQSNCCPAAAIQLLSQHCNPIAVSTLQYQEVGP